MTKDSIFVDTNVLVYALDRSDPTKQRLALEFIENNRSSITISTQVLIELHAVCTRKLNLDARQAEEAARTAALFPVIPTDRSLVIDAVRLARETQLSIFDATIVCAAQRGACSILATEDVQIGRRFNGLTVKSPFVD